MLRREIVQAGIDLFAAYGVDLSLAASCPEAAGLASEITFLSVSGFGGPRFSGFVALGAKERLLRRSNTTESSPGDWMTELSNQFLGRIKNHLRRLGIPIHRAPPAVVRGHAAFLFSPPLGFSPLTLMDEEDCPILIWMKWEPSTDSTDSPSADSLPAPEPDVLAEGEMVLF